MQHVQYENIISRLQELIGYAMIGRLIVLMGLRRHISITRLVKDMCNNLM